MKRILLVTIAVVGWVCAFAATGSKADPFPLKPGPVTVDFTSAGAVYYSYKAPADCMMTFSDMLNVNIYGMNITPTGQFYNESMGGVTYVQIKGGVEYMIEVNAIVSGPNGRFTFGSYESAWPDGGSWGTAVIGSERVSYVPVTLDYPAYIKYTVPADGVISVVFNSLVRLSYSRAILGTFTPVEMDYKGEIGAFRGYVPDVKAGETIYFTFTGQSALCSFSIVHPVTGESADFPYTLEAGVPAVFPKKAGTYYYRIAGSGNPGCLIFSGDEPFSGTASAGATFSSLTEKSSGRIAIRMGVSQYATEYCLVLNRTSSADADQTFTAVYSEEACDYFPGQNVSEGEITTGNFGGTYYYTFTVPTDGRKMISIETLGSPIDPSTKAAVYYANNQYSPLATGRNVEYEAVAGRAYTIAYTAGRNDAPVTFRLSFVRPAGGASIDTAIPAVAGDNESAGFADGSTVYFEYKATVDGWLLVTPAEGLRQPAISMMPIPTDPWMQACDVQPYGKGYRVSCEKDRGYMIMFTGATEGIKFNIAEMTALQGESASHPLPVAEGTAVIPSPAATYWFAYTVPASGKLVVSTDLPYQQTTSRQDYTYVRLYLPSDPDNFVAELRPDYDKGVFADKILDVEGGATYLVKVRTLTAAEGYTVTMTVRDPVAGETSSLPVMIPFDGTAGTYTFDRVVNYESDAVWYGIELPAGKLTIAGRSAGTFAATLRSSASPSQPLAAFGSTVVDYDEATESYIYLWSLDGVAIPVGGTYLLYVTDNEAPLDVTIDMSSAGIGSVEARDVCVTVVDGGIEISAAGADAAVYTVSGVCAASMFVEGNVRVSLPSGFYIVRVGNKRVKVAVR